MSAARLPDGIFAYQKIQLWYSIEGLGLENYGIIWYGH
jgi:hypothetical protein